MKQRRILALFMAIFVLTSVFSGCASGSSAKETVATAANSDANEAPKANDSEGNESVVYMAMDDPKDLSPLCTTVTGKEVLYNFYESFCSIDGFGGELYGVLAKNWHWEDDTHFIVEMYDNIYDSEGNQITAEDAVYSYQIAIDAGYGGNVSFVETFTVRDEFTMECYCPEGVALGGIDAFLTEYMIIDKDAYEASPDGMSTMPVGTGPYVVESFTSGSSLVLNKNQNYWQKDESKIGPQHQANVDKIVYSVISETSQIITALQTGTIDIAKSVDEAYLDQFTDGGAYADMYDTYSVGLDLIYFLAPNCSDDSPLRDENLRAAIFYGIDVNMIVTALGANSTHSVNAFCSDIYPDYVDQWDEDAKSNFYGVYDLDLAKEYLSKSSYKGETIVIAGENTGVINTIMQVVGGFLDALGIKYEINPCDSTTYSDIQKDSAKWDLWVQPYGSGNYIVTAWKRAFSASWRSTGKTLNFIDDAKLQELFEAALSVATHGEDTVYAFQDYLTENFYWYGLCYKDQFSVYNSEKITSLCYDWKNRIVPGGCTYAE